MNDHETFTLKNSLNKPTLGGVVIDNENCFCHSKTPTWNRRSSLGARLLCRELIQATRKDRVSET
jgi:hypothetical protein